MRAAQSAGREVFGYNRSVEGVEAARFDGYDATTRLDEALTRAAETDALIVLAVPVPALPMMLAHVAHHRPRLPADRRHQCQGRGARRGHRGRTARQVRRRAPDDGHRAFRLDGRGRAPVRRRAVGGQRRRPRRTGRLDRGDRAGTGLRRRRRPRALRRTRPRRGDRSPICRTCSPRRWPPPRGRSRWRSRWRRAPSGTAPGSPERHRTWCARCARPTPTQLLPVLDETLRLLTHARDQLAQHRSVADLVEAGHAARVRYDGFSRPEIVGVVVGARGLARRTCRRRTRRRGDQIRSASPG